jgi:rhamnosyltransferase subunit B
MTRYVLSALGSAGDVHPFIVVAQALQARGHDVVLIASPYFEARIAAAGIAFAALGTSADYAAVLQRPELWHPDKAARFIADHLLQSLPEAYATSDALASRPGTVLVGSTLSWGMRLVQERRRLPGATIHLSPVCLPSAIAPPILPGIGDLSWMPAPLLRLLQWAGERLVVDRLVKPRLDALRSNLGLPPVTRVWSRWMHSPDLVVGAWPAWFAPAQRDWPRAATTAGFPLFAEAGDALDPSLQAFLDDGVPPVGVTAGSAMAHGTAFYRDALAACGALGRHALLITAYPEQLPEPLPPWAHHVRYAPFSSLLPRLSALIHHGGIGTSAQALAAGIPQLVAPFAHDQFDNAARLRRLGVATTVVGSASPDAWTDALRRLTTPAVAAAVRVAAARMAAEPPAGATIAAMLETLASARSDSGRAGLRA